MAQLYDILKPQSSYFDRKYFENSTDYITALQVTTTVYVGNLSFYASQDSVYQLFAMAGKITEIIMGINDQGHPSGFCFVVYQTKEQAAKAVQFISRTKLHDRIIRVDWDAGYKEGREKGRGTGGQQRRDDFRTKEDLQRPRKIPIFEKRQKQFTQRQRSRQTRDFDKQKITQRRDRPRRQFETKGDRPYRSDRNDKERDRDDKNMRFNDNIERVEENVVSSDNKVKEEMIDEGIDY